MQTHTPGVSARACTPRQALAAILAEVSPGTRPFSAESWLPAHLVEQARLALTLPDPLTSAARSFVEAFVAGRLIVFPTPGYPSADEDEATAIFDAFLEAVKQEGEA